MVESSVVLPQRASSPIVGRHLIGGAFVLPEGAASIAVTSPYDGATIGSVPSGRAADVDLAVGAAKRAASAWGRTPIKERSAPMVRFRALLERHLDELGELAALESGKTIAEAKAGVMKGIEVLDFALSLQNLDLGGVLEVSRGVRCEVRREPLGVVAGITPFNFPAMVPMWMLPIAVTLGNAFVWKPSEKVPLTACRIGALFGEAGFPPGVLSIVHGARDAVDAILTHPDIAAIGFVGSSPVAKKVYATASAHGKRVLALGGAKNHLLVAPDCDVALTAQAVVDSFTGCAGQRCMAGSVLVAVGEVGHVIDEIVRRARAIELGRTMGAIIDGAARDRIASAIAVAEAAGARVLLDGRDARLFDGAPVGWREGHWLGPTILDGVARGSEAATREIFGPVLSIVRVPTLADALAIEAESPYGNATCIFTQSGGVAEHVATHARAGMIGVNVGVPVPREPFSFGGTGDSKLGHGDITGSSSIELWTTRKKITTKWATQSDANWMG